METIKSKIVSFSIKEQVMSQGYYLESYGYFQESADAINLLRSRGLINEDELFLLMEQLSGGIRDKMIKLETYNLSNSQKKIMQEFWFDTDDGRVIEYDCFDDSGDSELPNDLLSLDGIGLILDVRPTPFDMSVFKLTEKGHAYCRAILGDVDDRVDG